ncbi:hypothetical protein DEO72_LG8g2972 [Vigna unguiculata]|uniref:Uncharacterized protein n=1 Tax=Vigna unguiculata TaxID=3917 RepID=A0A4D6MTU2_VIGUN|nr:hypothetical protein DEO72_LG8g2972 [Vigna unguiculata]
MTPRKNQKIAASGKRKGMISEVAPIAMESTDGSSTRTTPNVPTPIPHKKCDEPKFNPREEIRMKQTHEKRQEKGPEKRPKPEKEKIQFLKQ